MVLNRFYHLMVPYHYDVFTSSIFFYKLIYFKLDIDIVFYIILFQIQLFCKHFSSYSEIQFSGCIFYLMDTSHI